MSNNKCKCPTFHSERIYVKQDISYMQHFQLEHFMYLNSSSQNAKSESVVLRCKNALRNSSWRRGGKREH